MESFQGGLIFDWGFPRRVGQREGASEAGAISRCKSGPGKAQQAAWKRVLREAAAMPNTKRTQRLRGVCD